MKEFSFYCQQMVFLLKMHLVIPVGSIQTPKWTLNTLTCMPYMCFVGHYNSEL